VGRELNQRERDRACRRHRERRHAPGNRQGRQGRDPDQELGREHLAEGGKGRDGPERGEHERALSLPLSPTDPRGAKGHHRHGPGEQDREEDADDPRGRVLDSLGAVAVHHRGLTHPQRVETEQHGGGGALELHGAIEVVGHRIERTRRR